MFYDISTPLYNGMPFYPGDPAPRFTQVTPHADGDSWTVSHMDMSAHTGTHIDAPLHFVGGGSTIDDIALDILIGDAYVADLTHVSRAITAADLAARNIPAGTRRLLFKTTNRALWNKPGFRTDYVALSGDAAAWVVARGIQLVALDYLSVDLFDTTVFPAHATLLGAGVVIVEGVRLDDIAPGTYHAIFLPLKLQGAEGAPARAVLIKNSEEEQ